MKLKQVTFNDDEDPVSAEFSLSVDEAALIYAFVGHVTHKAIADQAGAKWVDSLHSVAESLGCFFNRFWENGSHDVCPRLNPRVGNA